MVALLSGRFGPSSPGSVAVRPAVTTVTKGGTERTFVLPVPLQQVSILSEEYETRSRHVLSFQQLPDLPLFNSRLQPFLPPVLAC